MNNKKRIRNLTLTTCLTLACLTSAVDAKVLKKNNPDGIASKTEMGKTGFSDNPEFNLKSVQELWNRKDLSKQTIKSYEYDQTVTIPIQMRKNLHTLVVLPEWEEAEIVTLGDEKGFTYARFRDAIERKNMLVLNGRYAGSDTDMRIIGSSGRVYSFYLRNDPVDSYNPPHLTVYINSDAPPHVVKEILDKKVAEQEVKTSGYINPLTEGTLSELKKARADYLKFLPEASEINLKYTIKGSKVVAPRAVFDDGEGFTYFDFRETNTHRLPVVYQVIDGFDALVNTEFTEGFLIAKTISAEGFTLRNGDAYVCVRPE